MAAPVIDPRGYQELLDEALARIPVYTPEWTNFNRSDPGVTLVELFAFLTEALVYRANQIPERSRRKFLSLLGVPVAPAASARGMVAFSNQRGPLATTTVAAGLEVRAGEVAFVTELGLDILPVEGRAFVKQRVDAPDLRAQYAQLYASFADELATEAPVTLYATTPLDAFGPEGAPLQATVDGTLWVALLTRASDPATEPVRALAREQLAGRTVSLGLFPVVGEAGAQLGPALNATAADLEVAIPQPPPGGALPQDRTQRQARYRTLEARVDTNVLVTPGILQVTLPTEPAALSLWTNLDPLEPGAGDFPPSLEESDLEQRVVTWLRVRATAGARASLQWAGINAATVSQRARVIAEALPAGTGDPDQVVRLARTPVVAGSVALEVTPRDGTPEPWRETDELFAAGAEVPVRDPRRPPGTAAPAKESRVFVLDAVSGDLRFGDGLRGRRPPAGATLRADYDVGAGARGNVAAGAIDSAPALGAGIRVINPVATWGGADAESVAAAEKQAARYLQHRDRLVTALDFATIVRRTPGVQVGRVEVLPTFNPQVSPAAGTPGAVTVLVIPRLDHAHPAAPEPDQLFLDAVCRHLEPRRLVTTEVFLRGPAYVNVWVSVGIEVEAGRSVAEVREAVRAALTRFLAPLDPEAPDWFDAPPGASPPAGWPLGKAIQRLELVAVAGRAAGVRLVSELRLAAGTSGPVDEITLSGLQLPRLRAVAVGANAADLDQLRGQGPSGPPPPLFPVPVIPDTC